MRDADLVIMAGARVGDRAVAAPGQIATRAKVIHIDIDPAEIGKNLPVHIPIVGDLRQVLTELTRRTEGVQAPDEWVRAVVDRRQRYAAKPIPPVEGYVEPKSFMRTLSGRMQADCCLLYTSSSAFFCAVSSAVSRFPSLAPQSTQYNRLSFCSAPHFEQIFMFPALLIFFNQSNTVGL